MKINDSGEENINQFGVFFDILLVKVISEFFW
jgi:hypothetical protein